MSLERFFQPERLSGRPGNSQASQIRHNSQAGPSTPTVSDFPAHDRPDSGAVFPINWDNVFAGDKKLRPDRLSFRAKHSSNRAPSKIWRYGADLQYSDEKGGRQRIWLCQICHEQGSIGAGKSVNGYNHIIAHLLSAHGIDIINNKEFIPDDPRPFLNPFDAARQVVRAGSNRVVAHTPSLEEEEEEALQDAWVDWVIIADISFSQALSKDTRCLFLLMWNRPDLLNVFPSSIAMLSSYVAQNFVRRKEEIRMILHTAKSKITLSVDVWTSPGYLSFLAVVGHFFDAEYQRQDLLIGFKCFFSDHTGSNQSQEIVRVIDEYRIASKFSGFVTDNASYKNGGTINDLGAQPGQKLNEQHRIRCAGHTIQLVIKVVLYGKGVHKFEKQLARATPREKFELYRNKGVVGKLHNFVNGILSYSHKPRQTVVALHSSLAEELGTFGNLNLIADGGVRWHSDYFMLTRCLKLKYSINKFIRNWRLIFDDEVDCKFSGKSALGELITEEEWDEVERLTSFLESFYPITKILNGNGSQGSLWTTIINLQWLNTELLRMREELENKADDCYLKNSVVFGLEKLQTYWQKIILNPPISYYTVATILNPRLRLAWFKDHWRKHELWHKKAEASMEAVFQKYVEAEVEAEIEAEIEDEEPSPPARRKIPGGDYYEALFEKSLSIEPRFLLIASRSHKRARQATELQDYYDSMAEDLFEAQRQEDPLLFKDPITWWLSVGQKRFPTLFKMALDFLSIPSSSCKCERAFSGDRSLITSEQCELSSATIEALQLQRNWLRHRAVKSELNALTKHVQEHDRKFDELTPTHQ